MPATTVARAFTIAPKLAAGARIRTRRFRIASYTRRRMAFEKIDHVGIAVPDLDGAVAAYQRLTGTAPAHRQTVEKDGVEAVMFEVGESRIELLGSTRPDSKIANF